LKKSRNNGNYHKIKPEYLTNVQIREFPQFDEETGKTAECSFKKLIFGQTSMKFDGCYGNVKTYGHVIDISKFPQRMKEQLLKASASQSESPFQIKERKKARGSCIQHHPTPPTPPLVCPLCSVYYVLSLSDNLVHNFSVC